MEYTPEERIVAEAIGTARKVQDYIWGELNLSNKPFDKDCWIEVFQKRVVKISRIDESNPNYRAELRKRVLQQAALSILALEVLDKQEGE